MKKIIVFAVCALLALCLTSCSAPINAAPTQAPTEAPTPAPTADPHEGWMQIGFGIWIPQIPFEDWEGMMQDNTNSYTMYISSSDVDAFNSYAQSLPDFGYTLEQLQDYQYRAVDPEGNAMFLTNHGNGDIRIAVTKAK